MKYTNDKNKHFNGEYLNIITKSGPAEHPETDHNTETISQELDIQVTATDKDVVLLSTD